MVWVISITFLPFNAFHAHDKDEHFIAKKNDLDYYHHCEIDEVFCETGFEQACEHGSHIKSNHPDCFTCEFSFVKHFVISVQPSLLKVFLKPTFFGLDLIEQSKEIAISYNTRGPPILVV